MRIGIDAQTKVYLRIRSLSYSESSDDLNRMILTLYRSILLVPKVFSESAKRKASHIVSGNDTALSNIHIYVEMLRQRDIGKELNTIGKVENNN